MHLYSYFCLSPFICATDRAELCVLRLPTWPAPLTRLSPTSEVLFLLHCRPGSLASLGSPTQPGAAVHPHQADAAISLLLSGSEAHSPQDRTARGNVRRPQCAKSSRRSHYSVLTSAVRRPPSPCPIRSHLPCPSSNRAADRAELRSFPPFRRQIALPFC